MGSYFSQKGVVMRTFYIEPNQIKNDIVTIVGQDAKHLTKVLRLQPGQQVKVLDGSGTVYLVNLLTVSGTVTTGEVIAREKDDHVEPPIKINLIQGLPKQGKMEYIIQKCTEIGVCSITPLETERSIVKLTRAKARERVDRWQKVAIEAVKQCGRSVVPSIHSPQKLTEFLTMRDQDIPLIFLWEGKTGNSLKAVLNQWEYGQIKEVDVVIGPEGGFTELEVAQVLEKHGQVVTLGPRILRTETAGMAVATIILYELGDLGG